MDKVVRDFQSGRKDVTSVSSITTDKNQDTAAWKTIISDLQMLGIDDDVVRNHDALVIERVKGVLSEQAQPDKTHHHEHEVKPQDASEQELNKASLEDQKASLDPVTPAIASPEPDADSWQLLGSAGLDHVVDSVLNVSEIELAGGTLLTKIDQLVLLWDHYPTDEISASVTDMLKTE